jgi:HSP20 family protein
MKLLKRRPLLDSDRFFEDFLDSGYWSSLSPRCIVTGVPVPNVDIFEKNGSLVVKADIPGVEKDNINISITKDTLIIKGEVRKEAELKEENYYSLERRYGNFTRTIPITYAVDTDKAKANYKNGVLEIVLPKREKIKPKTIKVTGN